MKNLSLLLILSVFLFGSCNAQSKKADTQPQKAGVKIEKLETVQEEPKKEVMKEVTIETTLGNITIALYNETPLHRDNFIKLVSENYYDGVLFHRIIKGFMIQAGDPDSKTAAKGQRLGVGGPGYTIPAEIVPGKVHNRGALAAARRSDTMNSSGSQFYIVDNPGGAHQLDGSYTVFGEVVKGLETVDAIASQAKDQNDRPLEDVKIISMKIVER